MWTVQRVPNPLDVPSAPVWLEVALGLHQPVQADLATLKRVYKACISCLCLCINKGQVSSQWQELSLIEKTSCVERYRGQRVHVPPHLSALRTHEPGQAGCSRWKEQVQKAGDKFHIKMIVLVKQTTVQKKTGG